MPTMQASFTFSLFVIALLDFSVRQPSGTHLNFFLNVYWRQNRFCFILPPLICIYMLDDVNYNGDRPSFVEFYIIHGI